MTTFLSPFVLMQWQWWRLGRWSWSEVYMFLESAAPGAAWQPTLTQPVISRRRTVLVSVVAAVVLVPVALAQARDFSIGSPFRLTAGPATSELEPTYRLHGSTTHTLESAASNPSEAVKQAAPKLKAPDPTVDRLQPPAASSPSDSGDPEVKAASAPRLTWPPPTLTDPAVIQLTDNDLSLKLDDNKDYLLKINGTLNVGDDILSISGGRNVVLIGGRVNAPGSDRSIYLKNQTGTVHIEGVHLTGAGLKEGFNLDQRKGATVQLQNIKVDLVHGSQDGHHADLIQTWSGPDRLRIDRFDGSTTYQSMMLGPTQYGDGDRFHYDFRNVVTRSANGAGKYYVVDDDKLQMDVSNVVVAGPSVGDRRAQAEGVTTGPANTPSPLIGKPGPSYVSPGYIR